MKLQDGTIVGIAVAIAFCLISFVQGAERPSNYGRYPNGTTIKHYNGNGSYNGRSYYNSGTYRHYSGNGSYSGKTTVSNGYYRNYGANGVYKGSSRVK